MGRLPQAPAGVRADPERRAGGSDERRLARAAPRRRVVDVVRVEGWTERLAAFADIGLADHDRAGTAQPRHDGGVSRGRASLEAALAGGAGHALHVDPVLDGAGDTMQRAEHLAPAAAVGRLGCGGVCSLLVEVNDGMDHGVHRTEPPQGGLQQGLLVDGARGNRTRLFDHGAQHERVGCHTGHATRPPSVRPRATSTVRSLTAVGRV